jgi:hypothetical protein
VLGIHALHSGMPRYGLLGTTGAVLTIAGYLIIAVVTVISMVQGQASLPTVRLAGAAVLLIGSILLGGDHHPCPVAALVVRCTAYCCLPSR